VDFAANTTSYQNFRVFTETALFIYHIRT